MAAADFVAGQDGSLLLGRHVSSIKANSAWIQNAVVARK